MCVHLMQMGSRSGSGGSFSRPGPGSVDMPMNKTKGHRKTASLGQGSPSIGELGPEWTEEVDQVTCDQQALEVLGWHLTMSSAGGLMPRLILPSSWTHVLYQQSKMTAEPSQEVLIEA